MTDQPIKLILTVLFPALSQRLVHGGIFEVILFLRFSYALFIDLCLLPALAAGMLKV